MKKEKNKTMGKYFNVTVKPPITVAALAAGNITDTEILFDWHAFDIPKGAARLVGVTILYAGKNGADYTPTDFELFWGRGDKNNFDAPETLGSDGAAVNGNGYLSHIMGKTYVDASNGTNDGDLITGNVISVPNVSGGVAGASSIDGFPNVSGLVLQGVPDSGTNVGYDKLYVAAIAKAIHNWGPSTMTIDTTVPATTSPIITVADLSPKLTLGPGDVLRDEDNQLIGTVKKVDSATQLTLEANSASVVAEDKLVYNTTPITLLLSFEK